MIAAPDTTDTPVRKIGGSGARPRRLAAVGLVILLMVAGGVWVATRGGGDPTPGPMGSDDASALGMPQVLGKPAVFGLAVARNRGDEPAVIDRIALIGAPPGLEVVETHIGGNERKVNTAADYVWPSKDYTDLHSVKGYRVMPIKTPAGRHGAQLVFVLKASKPGRYAFKAVQIDYHVGDTRHRAKLRKGLAVCYSTGRPRPGRCQPPNVL